MIKSSVTDLLSGAESGEIWIKRISRLPENLPTADHKLSFLFLSAQAKILFGCSCLEQQNVLTSRRRLELLDHTKPYWDGMVPPPENRGARFNGSFYILIHPSEGSLADVFGTTKCCHQQPSPQPEMLHSCFLRQKSSSFLQKKSTQLHISIFFLLTKLMDPLKSHITITLST